VKKFLILLVFLSLTAPIFFILFLIFYNYIDIPFQFSLSVFSSYFILIIILLFLIKKFKINTKMIFVSCVILVILSSFFIIIFLYLPGILMLFNLGPSKHWPIIFIAQRLNLSEYTICWTEEDELFKSKPDIIKAEWTFKKPEGFRYVYSAKFTKKPVRFASFYYPHKESAQKAFTKYKKELKLEFKEIYLNLSLNKTYDELIPYNNFTVGNDRVVIHCELLVRERSNNAVILVVMADRDEMDLLKRLLN